MQPPQPRWRVDTQQQTRQPTQSGRYETGYLVYFTALASNVQGSVFVTEANYTADNVKQLINAKVAAIDAVHGLIG